MRTNRILVPAITAAALITMLAGCSAGESTTATKADTGKPSASASQPSSAPSVLPDDEVRTPETKADATCTDGSAVIDQSGTEVTLKGACPKVTVSANDAIVHLGDVDELIVEGSLTRVTVGKAKSVSIVGNANDVLFAGDKPAKVSDKGEQNVVQQQSKK